MRDGQGQRIFARLGEDEREAFGRERLEFVGIEMEHAAFGCGNVGARQRGLRQRRGEQGAEQVRGAFAEAPLDRLQTTIAPSSIRRRKVMVLRGCASMLRRLGTMSTLPILFWMGAIASVRKLSP